MHNNEGDRVYIGRTVERNAKGRGDSCSYLASNSELCDNIDLEVLRAKLLLVWFLCSKVTCFMKKMLSGSAITFIWTVLA
jgi:hypothetical protein